ncbi:MAG: PQQ-binding-like beta-propeller repeat protein [Phyllobacteriaceae bacterium]|nr:PQQ-binding-like beta-propeller repeat protein [Phyllobacteriaceae bacterium]
MTDWASSNGDVINSRHAADEVAISTQTVPRLRPDHVLVSDGSNWSTPVVVGETFFFTDDAGSLTCADRQSGKVLWSRKIAEYNGIENSNARTSVVVTDDLVIVGDRAGANLIAAKRTTGERV